MDFITLRDKALAVRNKINQLNEKNVGHAWSNREVMEGMVGDVGDLMKLIMAKEGSRTDKKDVEEHIKHEISDILWCLFNLADRYNIDLESTFMAKMDELDKRVSGDLQSL